MLWVKDFKGHSGCSVRLFNDRKDYIVVKSGSPKIKKSAEILLNLQEQGFNIPEIYQIGENFVHMQYLNGVDMKNYIHSADKKDIENLINFIDSYIEKSAKFSTSTISSEIYKKLLEIESKTDLSELTFNISDLLEKLPMSGKIGLVHGDFTLDNILFYKDQFYLIDANPTDINSIEFDANKIRQDLDCLWFVRNQKDKLSYKITCDKISSHLKNKWDFMSNDYILIFMLMRILPYCTDDTTKNFLILEINKLWQ